MTAVVGPNGSGKSNVSDAIRWALGEQSARSIRARKTEDVIFSGSDKRRPMGMAEVTLTLDNSEGWMPIDFREVTVTRRAHRTGENEYFINGQKVRLLDVQDLFRRAQVGQNSYAMMTQGLVDEVLALRPIERRDLIEEAADVHRHRLELVRSERRLTETRDNLGHVRMLVKEVEPRLRSLDRQAARAERYKTLHAELSEVLQVYYEHELRAAQEALAAARAEHDQKSQEFASAQAQLAAVAARLESVDVIATERRMVLDRAQAEERTLAEEGLRLQQAVALAEQRLELLTQRAQEVEAEIAAAPALTEAEEAADDSALDARVLESQTTLEREREALRSADEAARGLLRSLSEVEARRTRLEGEIADLERRIAERQAEAARRETARAEAQASAARGKDRLRDYGKRALELHHAGLGLMTASGELRHRREVAERQQEEQLRLAVEANDAHRQAQADVSALEQRLAMLETLLATAQDAGEDGTPTLQGIVGVVRRLLHVPDGLEQAIEAALAEQISAVVVERADDAIAAVQYLREHGGGSLTVLPLDGIAHQYPINLFNERGVLGVAARLVRVDQRYRPLIDTLLGRTIVVESIEVAREMVGRGLGSVVTTDGILLRQGGAVYGGRGSGAAELMGLQREVEALPERIDAARLAEQTARERFERAEPAVLDAREAVSRARTAVDEAEERRRAHEQARTHLRRELVQISGEIKVAHRAMRAEAPDATQEQALRVRLDDARPQLGTLGEEITTLRERSEALSAERDATAERVTNAATALATATSERDGVRQQRVQRAQERRAALERMEQRQTLLGQVRREREDVDLNLRDLRERLTNNRSALTESEQAVAPAHAALADVLAEQRELQASRGDAQARLFGAERDMLGTDAELAKRAQQVQSLLVQITDEGLAILADGRVAPVAVSAAAGDGEGGEAAAAEGEGVEAPVPDVVPASGGAEIDPEAMRGRITELRADIRALGPVNIDAVEDLLEERERFTFLSGQIADLEAAEGELRGAIKDLEKLIRERFDETFVLVNQHFQQYFTRFFGGGQAELKVIELDDGERGVEIMAQPPGKRVSSLNVLSGGERSMTSVALLFSLLAVNPAPVCILDEVDAALDEANVGRFVDTLKELTERSQFIVITHNRRSVEAADTIYGVSMGDESTSQVLSLSVADLPRAS
jgi:chromosome segregation protein